MRNQPGNVLKICFRNTIHCTEGIQVTVIKIMMVSTVIVTSVLSVLMALRDCTVQHTIEL